MKILNLTKSHKGGAGRAVYRLHRGLVLSGVDSYMLTHETKHPDPTVLGPSHKISKAVHTVRLPARVDRLALHLSSKNSSASFASSWYPDGLHSQVTKIDPDIINLNWVCKGFMRIETIGKFNKPLIWTLLDMWPFTGGCFYTQGCTRYSQSCGQCPQLGSTRENDLSRKVWHRKAQALEKLDLTIVSPSTWLSDCARESSLFKNLPIKTIPYGLDTASFKPINQQEARKALNLPLDKQLVLFGAVKATSDPRKGFQLLCPALEKLHYSGWQDKLEIAVFGASAEDATTQFSLKANYLGFFYDDLSLAMLYSAADVMVVPSLQEAFGQTASEALACGTPVVAFDQTGVAEIVDHKETGYLATPFEVNDLAAGIAWVLEDPERYILLKEKARTKAISTFSYQAQANRYIDLFHSILEK